MTSVGVLAVGCVTAATVVLVQSGSEHDAARQLHPVAPGVATSVVDQSVPTLTPALTPQPRSASTTPSRNDTARGGRPPTGALTPTSVPAPPANTSGRPDEPVAISIGGTADVSASVIPVSVEPGGEMEIPERVSTVGWYRHGPRPGAAAGSMVIVGHVDSAAQGEGAFFRLHTVAKGAPIEVVTGNHQVYRYTVVARKNYPKSSVPLPALFSLSGRPRLTLITCGGSFDSATGSYLDNIVVTAQPVGSALTSR